MSKYAHADVLDGGLNAIRNGADEMWLLKAYAVADNFATVSGNKICAVPMAPSDYTLSGADGAARVLTVAAKSGTATANSGATPDLHLAFVNTAASKVLMATDETSDQVVTSGNTVSFPALTYTSQQPA